MQAGLQQDDYIHGGESNISAKARGKQRANTAAAGHSLLDVDQHYLPVTDEKLPHPMSNDEDQLDDPENGNIANHDPSHYAILRTSEAQAYLQQQLQQASPVHVQAWIDLAQRACQTLQDKNNTGRKFKRELLKPTAATAPLRKRLKDYEANMSDRDRAVAVFKLLGWIEYNGTQNEPVKQLVLSKIYGTSPSSVTKTLNRKRRILYGDEGKQSPFPFSSAQFYRSRILTQFSCQCLRSSTEV